MTNSTDEQRQIFKANGATRPFLAALLFVIMLALAAAMIVAVTQSVVAEFKLARPLFQNSEPKDSVSQDWRRFLPKSTTLEGNGGNDQLGNDHGRKSSAFASSCQKEASPPRSANNNPSRLYAFVTADLEDVANSVQRTCDTINVFVPEWLIISDEGIDWLQSGDQTFGTPYVVRTNPFGDHPIQPLMHVQASALEGKGTDHWSKAARLAERHGWSGLCFDMRRLETQNLQKALVHLNGVKDDFIIKGLETCAVIAPDQIEALAYGSELPDRVILPAVQNSYRLSIYEESPAPLDWFRSVLERARSAIPSEKLVIGLASGGVHWTTGSQVPEFISYADAMSQADQYGAFAGYAPDKGHGLISYMDADGERNMIWYLDAVSHYSQLLSLAEAGIDGVAIWGLGQEDPSIWPLLAKPDILSDEAFDTLSEIDLGSFVSYRGTGPFLRFDQTEVLGHRHVTRDSETLMVIDAVAQPLPTPVIGERYGSLPDKSILLTFDDGPAQDHTQEVLDILKDAEVPATFFMVGNQMFEQKNVVNALADSEFDFGLHTFSHPQLDRTSPARVQVELALQSRIFSWLTGRTPVVFRAPYMRGPGPLEGDLARRLKTIVDQRYHLLGADIVPPDWRSLNPQQLVDYTLEALDGTGQVLLMHDGGGERSNTIDALRLLLPELKARGYQFLTLNQAMAGFGTPYETRQITKLDPFEALAFTGVGNSATWVAFVVPFAVLLGVIRALILFVMAIRSRRADRADLRHRTGDFSAPVTVVIPAYNEEKSILKTIYSVLDSDYPNLSVLVVDDGSTDATHALVTKTYKNNPSVQILRQPNGGKWKAANLAFSHVTTDYVVAIDADTIVAPDAIRRLMQPLRNPNVGAVAGKIMVGNSKNLLTKLEKLEYTVAQNIDRRAYETINAIMVVPGAFGAWRTEAVRRCGYYSSQTLAEDTDLTISLLEKGYEVRAADRAYAYTEAPASVGTLMKQRMRWSIGILQSAWKHRRTIRKGHAVGLVGLTDLVVFGVIMPLLGPIIDLLLVLMLVRFVSSFDGTTFNAFTVRDYAVLAIFLALPLLEMVMADFAVRSEPSTPRSMVFLLLLNRLIYRQLLIINVYRSLWRILTGRLTGWHKLRRFGSVEAPTRPTVAARAHIG
ncbi:glycosyltransferase [Phaeobacter porticola]|uniref:Chitooligosaccharide deacetylase n=1 Tax=Phaeobacter porticola TaxID=1844006 RepID=A0A1L3I0H1_9RHOB|nr:glycosyltransferase [Phaeobacter porticola]APG45610.1 putative glycosyltransferase / polysaccharide deacetylase [Phaeobacter porticola]